MKRSKRPAFRIYINDRGQKLYLMSWIRYGGKDHLVFVSEWERLKNENRAMQFRDFNSAMERRRRMIELGYDPHIE